MRIPEGLVRVSVGIEEWMSFTLNISGLKCCFDIIAKISIKIFPLINRQGIVKILN